MATPFDQKRFDELTTELSEARKRHAAELATIQAAITKVLFGQAPHGPLRPRDDPIPSEDT